MKDTAGGIGEFGMDFRCLYVFSGALQPYGNKRDVQASGFLRSFCLILYFHKRFAYSRLLITLILKLPLP